MDTAQDGELSRQPMAATALHYVMVLFTEATIINGCHSNCRSRFRSVENTDRSYKWLVRHQPLVASTI